MNNDDLLAESMRALRESTDGSSPHALKTRLLILTRAQSRMRRRRRVAFVVMPLAAALTVSTAWGAMSGGFPSWLDAITGRTAPTATAVVVQTPPTRSAVPGPAPSEPPRPATEIPSPGVPSALSMPPSLSHKPSAAPPLPKAPVVSNGEQSLYATAHRAHFVDHDSAASLRAWDAYLAAYSEGRFALEARYNRAICLVRLGRRGEARTALAPFAEGKYQGYRRAEARELLDALVAADGDRRAP